MAPPRLRRPATQKQQTARTWALGTQGNLADFPGAGSLPVSCGAGWAWAGAVQFERLVKADASSVRQVGEKGSVMTTTLANLKARKQQLVDRLHDDPGPNERAEIERLLADIDAAFDLLEEPDKPDEEQ
jgi:hypothetical protein